MNNHDKVQNNIHLEQTAMKILGVLIQHDNMIMWTSGLLATHLREDEMIVSDAILLLRGRSCATVVAGNVSITEEGRELYEIESKNSTLDTSELDFRWEALTGTDLRGKQSKIDRAALPAPKYVRNRNAEEDAAVEACSNVERIELIAKKLGLELEETVSKLETGEIHWCRGRDGAGHWGVFLRHRAPGHTWQHICKKCMSDRYRRKKLLDNFF